MTDEPPMDLTGQKSQPKWRRGLFMLLFLLLFRFGQSVMTAAAVLQFFWLVFADGPNAYIARFGRSLARWMNDVALYLFHDTDQKPFPWDAWPTP